MELSQAIKYLGTKEMLAHKADVSISTVRRWIEKGEIPLKYQKIIDYNTKGNLKANKRDFK